MLVSQETWNLLLPVIVCKMFANTNSLFHVFKWTYSCLPMCLFSCPKLLSFAILLLLVVQEG